MTPFILLQSRALIESVSLLPEKLRELQTAPRVDRHSPDSYACSLSPAHIPSGVLVASTYCRCLATPYPILELE